MRVTVTLDDNLFATATELTGAQQMSALTRQALTALVEWESARRLAKLGGSQPGLLNGPRHRYPE